MLLKQKKLYERKTAIKLICFTGKQGSGKTTAAQIYQSLLTRDGITHQTIKFADPIYTVMRSICNDLHLEFDKTKLRPVMQFIGSHMRNTYGEEFWVRQWENKARRFYFNTPSGVVLCDDVRFDNEAKKVKELGGIIVHLKPSEEVRASRIEIVGDSHESEAGISQDLVDYTIENNGSKDQLTLFLAELNRNLNHFLP